MMKHLATKVLLLIIFLIIACQPEEQNQLRLPKLISDGMILQRNRSVNIWGWANPKEKVDVHFMGQNHSTATGKDGKWKIQLASLKAGGPYQMTISTKDSSVVINDILVGDIWLCSGQSNMELPIKRVEWVYKDELSKVNNAQIRQFYIPRKYSFTSGMEDVSYGNWTPADQDYIMNFSATGYFFAHEINQTQNVPVGIINCALGGSPIEAWMSEEALRDYPDKIEDGYKYKSNQVVEKTKKRDSENSKAWYENVWQKNVSENGYNLHNHNEFGEWPTIHIPGLWYDSDLENVNGMIWFKKKINIPKDFVLSNAMLIMGRIVDADSIFINGKYVGRTTYQFPPRRYSIPEDILKHGENIVTVQVISNAGTGGFIRDKIYALTNSKDTVPLIGPWHYKIGARTGPTPPATFIRWKPMALYNGMLYPICNYSIKGVLWYQGESNTHNAREYSNLLQLLIQDWRSLWGHELPFIVAQLPNFMETSQQPQESNWALLRESQQKVLSVPNTALSVNIDLGEWNDIHPLNKKDVGKRLALASRTLVYEGHEFNGLSPVLKNHTISSDTIILEFENTYNGLLIKGGSELQEFSIAGADKVFKWAKALIKDNMVYVWSTEVSEPVAVRYAWANNPACANLYNSVGLPASPFRTDEW